jgi:hypothetical protein
MLATTLQVAAIQHMRLEPERKGEIVERVRAIQTLEQAQAYLREVSDKIKAARQAVHPADL